jgi:hypothetical protein
MPDSDPPKEPFIASKAVTAAVLDAINSQHHQAVFRATSSEPHVNLTLKGTAGKAASAFIMSEAQRQLCNRGTLTTLTCNDKPGHAYYYFDVSTGGQDRRVEIGVTFDTDRAEYLIKKVSSVFK